MSSNVLQVQKGGVKIQPFDAGFIHCIRIQMQKNHEKNAWCGLDGASQALLCNLPSSGNARAAYNQMAFWMMPWLPLGFLTTWMLQKNMDEILKRRTWFGSWNDWKKIDLHPPTPCTKPLRIHQNIPWMIQSLPSLQKLPLHCFTQRVQKFRQVWPNSNSIYCRFVVDSHPENQRIPWKLMVGRCSFLLNGSFLRDFRV